MFRPLSYHQTGASNDEKETSRPELPIWGRTEDFCDVLPVCRLWWRLGHEVPPRFCQRVNVSIFKPASLLSVACLRESWPTDHRSHTLHLHWPGHLYVLHLKARLLSCQPRRGRQGTQQSTLGPHADRLTSVTDPLPEATAAGALSSLFSECTCLLLTLRDIPAPRKQTVLQPGCSSGAAAALPCPQAPCVPTALPLAAHTATCCCPFTSVHPCRTGWHRSSPPSLITLTLGVKWVCTPGLESLGSESFFPALL